MVWARGLELCGYLIVKYVACMSKVYTEGVRVNPHALQDETLQRQPQDMSKNQTNR